MIKKMATTMATTISVSGLTKTNEFQYFRSFRGRIIESYGMVRFEFKNADGNAVYAMCEAFLKEKDGNFYLALFGDTDIEFAVDKNYTPVFIPATAGLNRVGFATPVSSSLVDEPYHETWQQDL